MRDCRWVTSKRVRALEDKVSKCPSVDFHELLDRKRQCSERLKSLLKDYLATNNEDDGGEATSDTGNALFDTSTTSVPQYPTDGVPVLRVKTARAVRPVSGNARGVLGKWKQLTAGAANPCSNVLAARVSSG